MGPLDHDFDCSELLQSPFELPALLIRFDEVSSVNEEDRAGVVEDIVWQSLAQFDRDVTAEVAAFRSGFKCCVWQAIDRKGSKLFYHSSVTSSNDNLARSTRWRVYVR